MTALPAKVRTAATDGRYVGRLFFLEASGNRIHTMNADGTESPDDQ